MKLFFEDSWQSRKKNIDWNKLSKICNNIFNEDETKDIRDYADFQYKPNYLLVDTILYGGYVNTARED